MFIKEKRILIITISMILLVLIGVNPVYAVYGGINLSNPLDTTVLNAGYLYAEVDSTISSYGHQGVDFRAQSPVPVYAAYGGRVITVADKGNTSYGKYIIIESDHPQYPGTKFYQLYAHLSRQDVAVTNPLTVVQAGQQIGLSGNTGGVGYHLHFEIRMGTNSWYSQRNPEGLMARSTSDNYGGILGEVRTSSGSWARKIRVSGAQKPTDYNYGASYTYYLMANGNPFPDESAYGINYYIGRASTGTKTLSYNNGARTQIVTIYANSDYKVSTITLP